MGCRVLWKSSQCLLGHLYLSPTVISSLCFDQVWFTVLLHCGSLCLLRMEAVLIRGEMYLPRKHVTSKGKFSRGVTS